MKRIVVITAALALAVAARSYGATNKGIEGSPHDFSIGTNTLAGVANSTWNTRNGVCSPCHAAHHTSGAQEAPLWVHNSSSGPWVPYSNPNSTLNATVPTPDGVSVACLSCHDGTVAVNQLTTGDGSYTNGNANSVFIGNIDPQMQIGPDLHTTHPISFVYDTALATADGALEDPSTYKIGDAKTKLTVTTAPVPTSWSGTSLTGKTIKQAMLFNDKMQCASCHDVHKLDGSAPSSGVLTRLSGNDSDGRGSILCRTCHIK